MIGKRDGVYYFSVRVNGKQYFRQNREWKYKNDVKIAMEQFLESLDRSKLTMDQLFDQFTSQVRVAKGTMLHYKWIYKVHFLDYFKDVDVKKLTNNDVRVWQLYVSDKGFKTGTNKNVYSLLRMLLNYAYEQQIIPDPLTVRNISVKAPKREMNVLTENEFNDFIKYSDSIKDKTIYTVLFYTGMRIGELLGLFIDDYDGVSLKINKQFNLGEICPTKNRTNRVVGLNKITINVLDEYIKTYQDKIKSHEGSIFNHDHISKHSIDSHKNKMLKSANITKHIRIHDFRHSHASHLLRLGFSYVDVAKRLGDKPETIMLIYGHALDDSDERIVEALNK